MTEMFAEREKKRKSSVLPKIMLPKNVHMPLASIAVAARHIRTPLEQTHVGEGAVAAADFNMRVAGNVSRHKIETTETGKRFLAMLERVGAKA